MITPKYKIEKYNLERSIQNIRFVLSEKELNNLFNKINNSELTLEQMAEQYDLEMNGLYTLYSNYMKSLQPKVNKTKSNKKTKKEDIEDQYYNTNTLIKNLTLFKGADGKRKLKITYLGLGVEAEIVDGTKENCDKYKKKTISDGKKLVKTINGEIENAGGIKKLKLSSRETLLYNKWKLYLSMTKTNERVKAFAKTIDFDSKEIINEKLINYKKLNSLDYTLKSLKNDVEFIENCYQNRVKKSR